MIGLLVRIVFLPHQPPDSGQDLSLHLDLELDLLRGPGLGSCWARARRLERCSFHGRRGLAVGEELISRIRLIWDRLCACVVLLDCGVRLRLRCLCRRRRICSALLGGGSLMCGHLRLG